MTRTPDIAKVELDCRGQQCPEPVLRVARAAAELRSKGGFIVVRADDPAFPQDIEAWTRSAGAKLVRFDECGQAFEAVIRIGEIEDVEAAHRAPAPPQRRQPRPQPQSQPQHAAPTTRKTMSYGSHERGAHGAGHVQPNQTFDVRGEQCPGPIVTLAKAYTRAAPGAIIRMYADDPAFPYDLHSWIAGVSATLIGFTQQGKHFIADVRVDRGEARRTGTESVALATPAPVVSHTPPSSPPPQPPRSQALTRHRSGVKDGGCTLLVLHNDHEALLAALLVANGAAAQGMDTNVFFTFWGLNLLRADQPNLDQPEEPVGLLQRMMKWMMPSGPKRQPLGQMHFAGLGKGMLGWIMRRKKIMALPELMHSAQELGVRFTACTMSMSVMGITRRDLHPYPNLEYGGVATFIADARSSEMSLVF
jgi:TusA-related sulfurtransferase/peroxiredoxin family protein